MEVQAIAERALKEFPSELLYDSEYELEESEYRDLEKDTLDNIICGRVQNPQQLGALDVIQMDFRARLGDDTTLLVLHVPVRQGVTVDNIIQQMFSDANVVMVRKPLLFGKVLICLTPHFVEVLNIGISKGKPAQDYPIDMASSYLKTGNDEKAFEYAEASIRSRGGSSEAFCIKGQAATSLHLYDIATEAYMEAFRSTEVHHERIQILGRVEEVKKLREHPEQAHEYVSRQLTVKKAGVYATEPIAAGEVVVVSNGIEEGPNHFAMVLDACCRSNRVRRQLQYLWCCKLDISHCMFTRVPDDMMATFRAPEDLDRDDIAVDMECILRAVVRARMKGNGSSLWPFPCFFKEVAKDHSVDVQVKGRTMILRTNRSISKGEELTIQAKKNVNETRFFYEDGALIKVKIRNGGEQVKYQCWMFEGKLPPADSDWNSLIKSSNLKCRCFFGVKDELDSKNTDELVECLFQEYRNGEWKFYR